MNYGLQLSLKLEAHLAQLIESGADDSPDDSLEDRAMKLERRAGSGSRVVRTGRVCAWARSC